MEAHVIKTPNPGSLIVVPMAIAMRVVARVMYFAVNIMQVPVWHLRDSRVLRHSATGILANWKKHGSILVELVDNSILLQQHMNFGTSLTFMTILVSRNRFGIISRLSNSRA